MCLAGRTPLATMLLLVLVIVHAGNALKCFECSTDSDSRCKDYFDKSHFDLKDCEMERHNHINMEPYCRKLVHSVEQNPQHNDTMRSCVWANVGETGSVCRESLPSYPSQVLYCSFCREDACNGALGPVLASPVACLLPALVAAVFKTA